MAEMIPTAFLKDIGEPAGQVRLVAEMLGAYDMEVCDGVVTYRWPRTGNGTLTPLSLDLLDEPFTRIFGICVAARVAGVMADRVPRDLYEALAGDPQEGRGR